MIVIITMIYDNDYDQYDYDCDNITMMIIMITMIMAIVINLSQWSLQAPTSNKLHHHIELFRGRENLYQINDVSMANQLHHWYFELHLIHLSKHAYEATVDKRRRRRETTQRIRKRA